jgi:hypothetical protein
MVSLYHHTSTKYLININRLLGCTMPTFGLGISKNEECAQACKVALQNGYRWVLHISQSFKTQLDH